MFLRDFATAANIKGYDIIVSECILLSPKVYEHLLIPELKTAFICSTPINDNEIKNAKIV